MTDEPKAENPGTDPTTTAPEGASATATEEKPEEGAKKLKQTVEMRDIGPCKKHIKVIVDRVNVDELMDIKFKELVRGGVVAGFRPGKAPRKIIVRRFHKEVAQEVKNQLLVASLEQLAEDEDIAPLSPPNINPDKIEIPQEGPFIYEFDVEVRPEFDLPEYKGLKIRRPVHTFTDEEYQQEERRLLSADGQIVPKPEGNAQVGDVLVADVVTRDGDKEVGSKREMQFHIEKQIAFKDCMAPRFAEQVQGANAGEQRTVDVVMSAQVADPALRGKTLHMQLDIKEVKAVRLPELNEEYLNRFGVQNVEQLRELLKVVLERRLEYQQNRSAREQILQHIAASAKWDLPEDLLIRQARRAIARRIMEMRSEGISEDEIKRRIRLMEQDILRTTELGLKEHFVLQKIAEVEKIEVSDEDLDDEIERIAAQNDESPRKVRARLEKEEMLEALAAEMIERKTVELILQSAEYEDVPIGEQAEPNVGVVEEQAVSGEMRDLAAEAAQSAPTETPAEPAS